MIEFDFQPRTRIVFGPDRIEQLGELARELGAGRVLLVTDPGIVAAGHVEHGLRALHFAGLQVRVFDGVVENPTTDNVDLGLAVARDFRRPSLAAATPFRWPSAARPGGCWSPISPACCTTRRTSKPAAPCCWGPVLPGWLLKTRCSAPPMPWPIP